MSERDEVFQELTIKSKALQRELEVLAQSLNELEQTEVSAIVGGWEMNLRKVEDVKETLQ